MEMGNLRSRVGRGAPWVLTLAIFASTGQGFALLMYLLLTMPFLASASSGGGQGPGGIAVVVVTTLLGCALLGLTWVATLGARRAVIVSSIAGLLVAVAFPIAVERSASALSPGPTSDYEVGLTEVVLYAALLSAIPACVGSFVGFLVALAVAAWGQARGEPHEPETLSVPSPGVPVIPEQAFSPLPVPDENPRT